MSPERAGTPARGHLNREVAHTALAPFVERGVTAAGWNRLLDALEACVAPDPRIGRITRIEELTETVERSASWDPEFYFNKVRDILRGDE